MNKIGYYIVYALWYVASLLPMRIHYWLSNLLFYILFYVIRYRRQVVWLNVVTAFPEREPEEHKEIERRFYRWFCDYLVETIKLMTITPEELKKRFVFKGTELINQCIEEGQSCAFMLGHYCNWEWVTSLILWVSDKAKRGQIYHPLENKDFNHLFLHVRQRMGGICIPMNETLRQIIQFNRQGTPVAIGYIADQAPFWWNIHHWCMFLHHDTPVLTGTERIARKMNHAVFYLDITRPQRGYYEAEVKLITRQPQAMPEYEITDQYFRLLESSIQKHPEYYLWTHDRWKRTRERFNRRFEIVNGKVREKCRLNQNPK